MEILNRREQIGAKKLPPVIGDDVEKASASKYGVVKIGSNINVSNGKISVPAASDETAGVVKVGENLSVDENGFLNATGGGGGGAFDTLYEEPETSAPGQNTGITLSHTSDDYKMLVIIVRRDTAYSTHVVCPHPQNVTMACAGAAPNDTQAYNWKYVINGTSLSCTGGNSGNLWHKVYGYK